MHVRAVDKRFAALLKVSEPAVDADGLSPHEVSPLQGRLLELLARMCGACRILELGTLAGYSTLWLVRAPPPDGELITIEADAHHAAVARRNLAADARITLREGPAEEILPTLAGHFDFVFLDAEKRKNATYFAALLPLTQPKTTIVADNVVRHEGPGNFLSALADVADATAIQTTGAKGHDGFVLAVIRAPANTGRAPTA